MRRATTPTHTFTLPSSVSVDSLEKAILTYSQDGKTILQKNLSDLTTDSENNALFYELTQGETNLFAPGKALAQLRVKNQNNKVFQSQMLWVTVKPALDSEVI